MNKLYSVHDHWTDINKKNDVDIESIDGVITGIKVNGEDYGGGESDFSTAEVTVINNKQWSIQATDCPVVGVEEMLFGGFSVNANSQSVLDVVIYKGHAHILGMMTGNSFDTPVDLEQEASLSGNATYNAEEEFIEITGDCTITIS